MPLELAGLLLSGGRCAHTGCSFSCAIMHMSCRLPLPFCWLLVFLKPIEQWVCWFSAILNHQHHQYHSVAQPLTCIDKRRCPDWGPRGGPCRRPAARTCTRCDCTGAAHSASALAATTMSRTDLPGRCPMPCDRYSVARGARWEKTDRSRSTLRLLLLCKILKV